MYPVYDTELALLSASNLPYAIHEHIISQTVADARERLNFPLERLLKTVAFKDKVGRYYLAAVRGPDRIDYRKLAEATGVKRSDLAQLSPTEIIAAFGVEAGSVSPLLSQTGAVALFDAQVPTQATVFCGIGRPDRTLEILLSDLLQITKGRVCPLVKNEAEA